MTTERNKNIVRRYFEEGFNRGDVASCREFIAPSFVSHDASLLGLPAGFEGYRHLVEIHRQGFPDLRFKIEEMILNVDRVVVRWTWRGVHQGYFMGLDPTDLTVTVTGIHIFRIAHGKIAECWVNWDLCGLLRQLGHVQVSAQVKSYSLN